MHIICDQKKLMKSITTVLKGISNKSTMPVLEGIYMEAKDDQVKFIATDLELGIETTIETKVIEEGVMVLNARLLNEITRKLPNSQVEMRIKEDGKVFIKSEQSEFDLVSYETEEYPELPRVEKDQTAKIPRGLLKNMIEQTTFAVSQDESRLILTGGLLEIEEDTLSMVALDGYRLALRKGEIKGSQNHKVVIPGKTLNEVGRIIDEDLEADLQILFTDSHILFDLGKTKVISRLLEGQFIDYKQILPDEHRLAVEVPRQSLLHSIERASLLAKEGNNRLVKFKIEDHQLHISSNSEHGQVHEQIGIDQQGDDLEIAFNAKYLIDALKVIEEEEVKLLFTSNVSPGIITSTENDHYTYLVLPVRLSNS